MYAFVPSFSPGGRFAAQWAALALAGALSALGCATGRMDHEPLADHRLGSASKAAEQTADASGGLFGNLFAGDDGTDAEKHEIAEAAQNDPFPSAAEALGY